MAWGKEGDMRQGHWWDTGDGGGLAVSVTSHLPPSVPVPKIPPCLSTPITSCHVGDVIRCSFPTVATNRCAKKGEGGWVRQAEGRATCGLQQMEVVLHVSAALDAPHILCLTKPLACLPLCAHVKWGCRHMQFLKRYSEHVCFNGDGLSSGAAVEGCNTRVC